MKKIVIIGLSLLFSLGASAQDDYIKKEQEKLNNKQMPQSSEELRNRDNVDCQGKTHQLDPKLQNLLDL